MAAASTTSPVSPLSPRPGSLMIAWLLEITCLPA
jgi:hypothetical protein